MHHLHNSPQIRVLLIDDDPDLLKTAKRILNLLGNYEIDSAKSAEDASEKMTHTKFDVLVCDIKMPMMNGFEFSESLRAKGNNIPFIVFTVTEDKAVAVKAFRLGANGFVGKYGDPQVVFSTLKKCIDDVVYPSKKPENKTDGGELS